MNSFNLWTVHQLIMVKESFNKKLIIFGKEIKRVFVVFKSTLIFYIEHNYSLFCSLTYAQEHTLNTW